MTTALCNESHPWNLNGCKEGARGMWLEGEGEGEGEGEVLS